MFLARHDRQVGSRLGQTRHRRSPLNQAGQGTSGPGPARLFASRRGMAHLPAGLDWTRLVGASQASARHGFPSLGLARLPKAGLRTSRPGSARRGMSRHGAAPLGGAWYGATRQTPAGLGSSSLKEVSA